MSTATSTSWDAIKGSLQDAAKALQRNLKLSGYHQGPSGLQKKLNFAVDGHECEVIDASIDKANPVSKLLQQGHEVFYIRDVENNHNIVGYIDMTESGKTVMFENLNPETIESSEIQEALTKAGEKTMGAASGGTSRR